MGMSAEAGARGQPTTEPIDQTIPTPAGLHERLGRLLRELAELAEKNKRLDQRLIATRREAAHV